MSKKYIKVNDLSVAQSLYDFINNEAIPDTDINQKNFWQDFSKAVHKLSPKNEELLKFREKLQIDIDKWHIDNKEKEFNQSQYENFLKKIGYIVEQGPDFKIKTQNIDDEISKIAGPQLVCPVDNARFILNAANARYMSLYDSLYGSDVIESEESASERYDPERGLEVIKYTKKFLDDHFTLNNSSWSKVNRIEIKNNGLNLFTYDGDAQLINEEKYIGYRGEKNKPSAIILKNNNLHVEIIINPEAFSAQNDPAGISDIIVEAAISAICDNEDSVAAVDAEDKVVCYRNWLGLMKGNLNSEFEKNGKKLIRKLNPDRKYTSKDGKEKKLHGRSLLLNRNVGHLMKNPAILLKDGSEIPEGIMDAFIVTLCALHDIKIKKNSKSGSIYIVKPKQHSPDECKFTDKIFTNVEEILNLKKNTVKIGLMEEERRASVNLKECIRAFENRIFFINTGFLDRTGDEIRTSMEAGPMAKKLDLKKSIWIQAYENNNVDIGLECGFSGKAQIGKGMFAAPKAMAQMMDEKISHLEAGANCAWVPSPTAAALHSLHYHQIDIFKKQKEISNREKAKLSEILTIPVRNKPNWTTEEINNEVSNCAQGILGYVVRWINSGIGCSSVPDINNVALMEDRATCRISSQLISNWLHHGICSKKQVLEIMKKMAIIVDAQNKGDKNYQNMSPNYDNSIAFKSACELVFSKDSPNGYTEPILHLNRLIKKN